MVLINFGYVGDLLEILLKFIYFYSVVCLGVEVIRGRKFDKVDCKQTSLKS